MPSPRASDPDSLGARTTAAAPRPAGDTEPMPTTVGRFVIRRVLGAGAFGTVYLAHDPRLDREVAVKVPRVTATPSSAEVDRFLREARAAARIRHPNICPVHEADVDNGRPYIVMAYVAGQTLADALGTRTSPLPERQTALIVRRLALALQAAHDLGIVHRDLKPGNVLFDRDQNDVVITDFGLALRPDTGPEESGVVMGTPAYMPPEQARGDSRLVGPRSDIFSLGVMLYEMLAGRRPYLGSANEVIAQLLTTDPPPPSTIRSVDPRLEAICLRAMARNPDDRFASMGELAAVLAVYLQDPLGGAGSRAGEIRAMLEVFAAEQRARTPGRSWLVLLGLFGIAFVGFAVFALLFAFRSPTLKVVLDLKGVDLKDTSLAYTLDGQPLAAERLAGEIELAAGVHELVVRRQGEEVRRVTFRVGTEPGKAIAVEQDTGPPSVTPTKPETKPADEWVSLFNGKDLTGWKTRPSGPKQWTVKNGVLVGSGPKLAHLFTERGDFGDVHIRVEARCTGNGGVFARAPFNDDLPHGVEAQINPITPDIKTGSIYLPGLKKAATTEKPPAANVWFTMELIAQGDTFTVLVDGKKTAEATDARVGKVGHIVLQQHDAIAVLEVRDVRVKELGKQAAP